MLDRLNVINGDCLDVMREMVERGEKFDSIITDPPYHLTPIVDRFGGKNSAEAKDGKDGSFGRLSKGFMGKQWDGGDIAFRSETWSLCFDLLKSGGYLLAFSGTRTYHRMAVAIEDAGFEIRDQFAWVYGSGFPKALDISKAIDKKLGVEREVIGQKTTNIGMQGGNFANAENPEKSKSGIIDITAATSEEAKKWEGWKTAVKPAWEPIAVARKPLEGTNVENVLKHGTGALNIDACRIGDEILPEAKSGNSKIGAFERKNMITPQREWRYPTNIIHDGSPEVSDLFPEGAARFFYSAKAQDSDRMGSKHPTIKPLDLMAYYCRLVTPPNGRILDPFAGSGSTGIAAIREGFSATLIEREAEYYQDILNRKKYISGEDTGLFAL